MMDDPALGERGFELRAVKSPRRHAGGHYEHIESALLEQQKFRAGFLDDAHLDSTNGRKLLVLHLHDQRLMSRVGACRERKRAVMGIRLKYDARGTIPLLEHVGTGPNRSRHDIVASRFDRFARDGKGRRKRETFQ